MASDMYLNFLIYPNFLCKSTKKKFHGEMFWIFMLPILCFFCNFADMLGI